jgi:hypothetical protein
MTIVPQADYPLNGKNIIGFEAYMFMTKDKFITQHSCIPHSSFSIFERKGQVDFPLDKLDARKKALKLFNDNMRERVGRLPTGSDVGCCIIYLEVDASDEDNNEHYFNVYEQLSIIADKFCKEKNRVVAMLPHFHQGNDIPHIHCLYQRLPQEQNIFQEYIVEQLN